MYRGHQRGQLGGIEGQQELSMKLSECDSCHPLRLATRLGVLLFASLAGYWQSASPMSFTHVIANSTRICVACDLASYLNALLHPAIVIQSSLHILRKILQFSRRLFFAQWHQKTISCRLIGGCRQ